MLFKRFSVPVKVNIYLKIHLNRLISPSTDCVAQSVKRGMCRYIETLNTFYRETFSDFALKGSQRHESQYLPKGPFTPHNSSFNRLGHPVCKKGNVPL